MLARVASLLPRLLKLYLEFRFTSKASRGKIVSPLSLRDRKKVDEENAERMVEVSKHQGEHTLPCACTGRGTCSLKKIPPTKTIWNTQCCDPGFDLFAHLDIRETSISACVGSLCSMSMFVDDGLSFLFESNAHHCPFLRRDTHAFSSLRWLVPPFCSATCFSKGEQTHPMLPTLHRLRDRSLLIRPHQPSSRITLRRAKTRLAAPARVSARVVKAIS